MISLEDVFDALKYGELSQLSIGGQDQGDVNEHNWKQIVNSVQLGLGALYRRFNLHSGTALLHPVEGQYVYHMTRDRFRNSPSFDPVRNPFEHGPVKFNDSLIEITNMKAVSGLTFPINITGDITSIGIKDVRVISLPDKFFDHDFANTMQLTAGRVIEISYKGGHPKLFLRAELDSTGFDGMDFRQKMLELPEIYLEALLYFVAARFHNPIGMQNEFHSGNAYAQKYEMLCAQLEMHNHQNDEVRYNTNFQRNGFR